MLDLFSQSQSAICKWVTALQLHLAGSDPGRISVVTVVCSLRTQPHCRVLMLLDDRGYHEDRRKHTTYYRTSIRKKLDLTSIFNMICDILHNSNSLFGAWWRYFRRKPLQSISALQVYVKTDFSFTLKEMWYKIRMPQQASSTWETYRTAALRHFDGAMLKDALSSNFCCFWISTENLEL